MSDFKLHTPTQEPNLDTAMKVVYQWNYDAEVEELVLLHETGGSPDADLLQAADSLSFLEVNADLVATWFREGRCSRERAKEQLTYMFERIRVDRGRELARPLYTEGLAVVDRA